MSFGGWYIGNVGTAKKPMTNIKRLLPRLRLIGIKALFKKKKAKNKSK